MSSTYIDQIKEQLKKKNTLDPPRSELMDSVSNKEELSVPLICPGDETKEILNQIRALKVIGNKKKPIRFDDRLVGMIDLLNPSLGIDATKLVNFLVADFLEKNPEIKSQIKNTLKKL